MNNIHTIKKFNKAGLEQFKKIIERRQKGERVDVGIPLLTSPETVIELDPEIKIDYSHDFEDRLDCAEYIWPLLKGKWQDEWEHDVGLWSWFAALYFEQFCESIGKKTRKQEHYILSIGAWEVGSRNSLIYRHCVWGPVFVLRNPKLRHVTEFIVLGTAGRRRGMHQMGDAIEQTISTPKIIRSKTAMQTIEELYVDKKTRLGKKGFASAPPKKGTKKKSIAGSGGIRRLHLSLPRLKLTYNTEQLTSDEVIDLCGPEFSESKWNDSHAES
jgi:hypothetical protein